MRRYIYDQNSEHQMRAHNTPYTSGCCWWCEGGKQHLPDFEFSYKNNYFFLKAEYEKFNRDVYAPHVTLAHVHFACECECA